MRLTEKQQKFEGGRERGGEKWEKEEEEEDKDKENEEEKKTTHSPTPSIILKH